MSDTEILDYLQAYHDEYRGLPYVVAICRLVVTLRVGENVRERFTERIEEYARREVAARLLT